MTAPEATTDPGAGDRAFLGHPKGLGYLVFSEACERFSYYSMQSLLVLYLVDDLLKPGRIEQVIGFAWFRRAFYGGLAGQPLASAIFGTFTALVYASPILGGLVADRALGRRLTVVLGAVLMSLGHFLLAFEPAFLLALACLVIGVGAFKGNIASQVGSLYATGDLRRASAFQLLYVAISVGAIAAPLVSGTLGETIGWHWGFAAAGGVMAIGLAVYLGGQPWLQSGEQAPARAEATPRPKLSREDWPSVAALLLLIPVLALALLTNQQIFNAYLVWAQERFDLTLFGRRMPTTWLVTVDSALGFAMLVGAALFWKTWARARREPDEIEKMILGSLFSIAGGLCLVAASWQDRATGGKIGLVWPLLFHLLNGIAFVHILPVSLALVSKIAPRAINATAMGLYYLAFCLANATAGWVGGLYAILPTPLFWLIHVASAALGLLAFLLLRLALGGRRMERRSRAISGCASA